MVRRIKQVKRRKVFELSATEKANFLLFVNWK